VNADGGSGASGGGKDRSDRLVKKAWALMDAGQVDEAKQAFEQAAEASSSPARVWVEVGVASYQRDDLDGAEQAFARATEVEPGYLTAWNNLGKVRFARGQHKLAIACYKEVLARDGDNYRAWLNSGLVMADLERWEQALSCYDEALKAQREDPEALYRKGLALQGSGDQEGGLALFKAALAFRLGFYDCRLAYGKALREQGDAKGALIQLEEASTAGPKETTPRLLRGELLLEADKALEARTVFEEARELDKDCAEAWRGVGQSLIALGEEARGRLNMGTGWMIAGELEAALTEIGLAIDIAPELAEAHANRGAVLKRLERFEDAAEAYKAALVLDPNALPLLQNLGLLLCRDLGREDEGLEVLRKLVRLDPSRWFKLPSDLRTKVDKA
jgi:tetratricopeptide (TPR) repeat protein